MSLSSSPQPVEVDFHYLVNGKLMKWQHLGTLKRHFPGQRDTLYMHVTLETYASLLKYKADVIVVWGGSNHMTLEKWDKEAGEAASPEMGTSTRPVHVNWPSEDNNTRYWRDVT